MLLQEYHLIQYLSFGKIYRLIYLCSKKWQEMKHNSSLRVTTSILSEKDGESSKTKPSKVQRLDCGHMGTLLDLSAEKKYKYELN